MTAEDDWKIFPREGLGKLKFGMSPAEVDAWSATYGEVMGRGSDRASDGLLSDTLEKFGGAMSDEEKQAFIDAYALNGPSADSITETRGNPGLVLRYEADRLIEIMPAIGQRPLFLAGVDLLSVGALEALALMERHNGRPGRYSSTEAAFDQLCISSDGFCVTDKTAGVRTLSDGDERFRSRTVTLREKPYLPEEEMGRFIVHSVLE
ncbi:hypothetical protein [Agrobacterium rosae]|uniref:Uncharacterized protein n=1 Tax=Agrobacterium rosae TaxID=1972867 RepID=A0AAW9FS18_9HYPH|nr:hypothetical protein [Agrobacterium rosae]MDX8305966.1 hypothetical protein [Agrobacterium rosae]